MKRYPIFPTALFIFLLLVSCNKTPQEGTPKTLDGVYQQIGYGRIVTIEDGAFVLYDKTSISCQIILDGPISIYGENLTLVNDTLKLEDGINTYAFTRLQDIPILCTVELNEEQKNDPVFNFEVLAATFEQHYAYFELRNVGWDSLKTATKNKISPKMNDAELYLVFNDMLDSFGDGHISLDAPSEVEEAAQAFKVAKETQEESEDDVSYGDLQIAKMVSEHYLGDNVQSSRSDLIRWGFMDDDIGYLQINLMMGHGTVSVADSLQGMPYLRAYFDQLEDLETSEAHTRMEVEGIKATLQTALTELQTSKALVLDVRFNGGGKDEVALEIMRSFNQERRLVFTKKALEFNQFTPVNNVYLEASEQAYKKPVFIVTSRHSASATEIMVLSSLIVENVYRIGGTTEGVFSDVMEKLLPNGWEVGLSNEVYLDTKGTNYENIGIPAMISLNYPDDIQTFYRSLIADFEGDKQHILKEVRKVIK